MSERTPQRPWNHPADMARRVGNVQLGERLSGGWYPSLRHPDTGAVQHDRHVLSIVRTLEQTCRESADVIDKQEAELQALRALRPKCQQPGCVGGRVSYTPATDQSSDTSSWMPCPANCEDGFMSLPEYIAQLQEDGERLRGVVFDPDVRRQRAAIAAHDAVLKLAQP